MHIERKEMAVGGLQIFAEGEQTAIMSGHEDRARASALDLFDGLAYGECHRRSTILRSLLGAGEIVIAALPESGIVDMDDGTRIRPGMIDSCMGKSFRGRLQQSFAPDVIQVYIRVHYMDKFLGAKLMQSGGLGTGDHKFLQMPHAEGEIAVSDPLGIVFYPFALAQIVPDVVDIAEVNTQMQGIKLMIRNKFNDAFFFRRRSDILCFHGNQIYTDQA